jgi:hypothetical protein
MREALFILVVAMILFGLTAIRYRKQIVGAIGFARALKDAKEAGPRPAAMRREEPSSVQLVNCAKCGVWVPENKAIRLRDGQFYCTRCG